MIMSPGHPPSVLWALMGDPGAEPKHNGIMYNHLARECLRIPQESRGGCDLNKEHLGCFAEPAATIWRQICGENEQMDEL